jgi:choline dehydrogenase-like flavoprotein
VVGGGSILNGIVTTRGARAHYDAWEALGNPGWGWQGMLPYFKKV